MILINALKVAVLGGTGFVGQNMIKAGLKRDAEIVSLSRRGTPSLSESESESESSISSSNGSVKYLKCDCINTDSLNTIIKNEGPFDAYIHCVGLLLDTESGLSQFNKLASGSGSEPDSSSSTYDNVTRKTAFNIIESIESNNNNNNNIPFVFVSAAEAGWTIPTPIDWLERYLIAKRAVENKLINESKNIREIILRPSLIWTWERPQALASVIPFYIGNSIGLPFIDKPVLVEDLSESAWNAIEINDEQGIFRYMDMERLVIKEKC